MATTSKAKKEEEGRRLLDPIPQVENGNAPLVSDFYISEEWGMESCYTSPEPLLPEPEVVHQPSCYAGDPGPDCICGDPKCKKMK